MKTCTLRRKLFTALAGAALVVLAPAAIAAPDVPTDAQVASLAARADFITRPSTVASPFTLYIEDASGNARRLVRIEGSGWKFADDAEPSASRAQSRVREVSYEPSKHEGPVAEAVALEEPLTVFIDGASGFTFVYNQDGGWKFVGKLVDRHD